MAANRTSFLTKNLTVERAHFTPLGIYAQGTAPAPVNGDGGHQVEVGGDVAGYPIPYDADESFISDRGTGGLVGTVVNGHGVPTSSRRQ